MFTTGRGTPLGAPVPTIKIATNHALADKKANWIDFDAAQVLERPAGEVRDALTEYVISVASGTQTANERKRIQRNRNL